MAAARALRGAFEGIVADSLDRLREELVARHEELLREFLSERAQPPEPRAAAAPAEEELSAAPAECGGDAQEQPPSEPSTRRPRTSGGAATGKYFRPPARSPASSPTPSPRGAGDELQTQRRHAAEHSFDAASGESSGGLAEAAGGADTPGASPVPRLSRSGSVLIRTQGRHQTKNMFEAISHESDNGRVEAGGGADAPVLALASLEEHRVFREARLRRVETTDSFWKTTLLDDLDESTRKCVTQSRDLFRRKLRVGDMLVDRHRCQGLIQHPNSRYRLAWDLTGFLFIIYDLFVIPLYVFDLPDEGWAEVALMWVSVSFWTVDIFVSFCTGYYIDGFLEMRPSRIARRYLRSWFGPDVAIVLMDWAFVVVGLGDAAGILRIRRSLRALRIIRALRLVRLAKIREIFTKITDGINSEFVLILLSILKLVVSVVILNHYIACVWYALSGVQLSDSRQCSWVAKHGVDDASNTYKYLTSLHWSMTQFMPASMEVNGCNEVERAFTILVIMFGLVSFSFFVSRITAVMTQLVNLSKDQIKAEANLRQYLVENRVSVDLGMRIRKYFRDNYEARRKRIHEPDIGFFSSLPEVLKLELRREIYMPVVTLHPLLEQYARTDVAGIWLVCHLAMSQQSWLPSQTVFMRGERASEMLIVLSGSLEYTCRQSENVRMDQWLCEAVLWSEKWHYCGGLVAKGISEICGLSGAKFRAVTGERLTSFKYLREYASRFMAALRFAERTGPGVTDLCEDEGVLSQMVHSVFEDVHWISPDPAKFENTPPQVAPITRRANNDLCIQTSGEHRTQGADRSTPTSMSERRVPQRVVADEVENDTCSVRSA